MEGMEFVISILLLLNFFLLMIMMHSNRQLLRLIKEQMHQMKQMQERLMKVESDFGKNAATKAHLGQELEMVHTDRDVRTDSPSEQGVYGAKEEKSTQLLQVQEKEALINEVLSEVFI